ncbi:MAG: 7-cyano-7-deazaguanine synthase QueC [Bdellovibrionota bacterium]
MAVVLLSGGLDSALNLALAAKAGRASLALTMRYGQRAEPAEVRAAHSLAKHYRVRWESVDLGWLGDVNPTRLTRPDTELPQPTTADLDSKEKSTASMQAVWVANRNGLFLNVAAAYAEALGQKEILVGFNAEEAVTFPDNSPAFIEAIDKAFTYSTLNKVTVHSYTLDWEKPRIIREALEAGLPLDLVWSCYEGGSVRCWTCESCKRSERALLSAGEAGKAWLGKLGWKA